MNAGRAARRLLPAARASAQDRTSGSSPSSSALTASYTEVDPFVAASRRLQSLLAGVGDGETQFVDSMVGEAAPEFRLQTNAVLAAGVTAIAVFITFLSGNDPTGGASMSLHSLVSAGLGAALALPLVMTRVWAWSPAAVETMPQLDDMHIAQVAAQAPWYSRCAPWHVAAMMVLDLVPVTLLLLPAAQGGLLASVHLYSTALHGLGGGAGPSVEAMQLACLGLTAGVAALGKGLELAVSDQEYDVIQNAVANSDRYYRLMTREISGGPSSGLDPATAANAFRSVAAAWISSRNDASLAAMGQCFVDVMALGGMWYATHDLAAPIAATLAINAVDYHNTFAAVRRREARAAAAGAKSSSGGSSGGNDNRASQ